MSDFTYPPVSQRTYDRVTHLLGLDRTETANDCPRCRRPLVFESDDYGTGVRMYLMCDDPACEYRGERVA